MPTLDEVVHVLNGAKVFSKLDLNQGYHQLVLHPDSTLSTGKYRRYINTFIIIILLLYYHLLHSSWSVQVQEP